MTMFSMKPKFDLAQFLSERAPAGSARSRGRNRTPIPARETDATATEDATPETGADEDPATED